MRKRTSSRLNGPIRDRLTVGVIVGLVVGTSVLAGAAGSAFAGVKPSAATREFAHHIAHDNTTYRR
jgi:hypothetical protein